MEDDNVKAMETEEFQRTLVSVPEGIARGTSLVYKKIVFELLKMEIYAMSSGDAI